MSEIESNDGLDGVAIVGMSGRFAGARNLDEFWKNLADGVETITFFSDEELKASGVAPSVIRSPNYVKANSVLEDVELFDAAFFGMSPREAEILDPQHRLFLTCAWEALENAGYHAETYDGLVGIYGGAGTGYYLLRNIMSNPERLETEGSLLVRISNDKDFLVSQVSYKLDLRGPSVNVQTACSTSLVATHLAAQSLLNYQCDMALSGGVSLNLPQRIGYFARDGVYSPDGRCRAFDAHAQGTFGGSGVGMVVLKRLADAVEDGDTIHAVIKGSAINNDGAVKVGYTAPNVDGQAEVIALAQAIAGVEPETITYIEAHGTATPMGDPAEIAALTQAFRASTDKKNFCAVGSVKTNIGHLDAAAGIASLLKTVLSLKHRMLPPSLHFEEPNPEIDFPNSPFYVNAKLSEWNSPQSPRRAGISSFAVGGVNAHVIVEEAPEQSPSEAALPFQLILLSAKTDAALETATDNLCAYLREQPAQNFADIAYTLQVGRKSFDQRRMIVARDLQDGLTALETRNPKRLRTSSGRMDAPAVTFMFSGLGNHYVGMAAELYDTEPTFRQHVDECCEMLKSLMGFDLRETLYPSGRVEPDAGASRTSSPVAESSHAIDLRKMLRPNAQGEEALNETRLVHPAMFVVEYALAKMWMAWGVEPQAMIGYSLGEYVAACLAGVFSLEDALFLIAKRAELIQQLPRGAMLAVTLSEAEVRPLLGESLSLAAVNGESLCVVAGPSEQISSLERQLTERGLACRRLQTTHAFHSKMMDPAFQSFERLAESIELKPPQIPFVSNVTGKWITPEQSTSPRYWAEHMCKTVRFSDCLDELWKQTSQVLLEIGPGEALSAWALQHLAGKEARDVVALPSLRHSFERYSDREFLLHTLGKLWLAGIEVDWRSVHGARRRRIPLPTYPFEARRYWIEDKSQSVAPQSPETLPDKEADISNWFYAPVWKHSPPQISADDDGLASRGKCWLIFADEYGIGSRISERLRRERQDVFIVKTGDGFARLDEQTYAVKPNSYDDYDSLLNELRALKKTPQRILHLWSVSRRTSLDTEIEAAKKSRVVSFDSLLLLAQALGNHRLPDALHIDVVSNDLHDVTGEEDLQPVKATLLGPCKVIPQEYPNISCRSIDVVLDALGTPREEQFFNQIFAELSTNTSDKVVAYRGLRRWLQSYEPVRLGEVVKSKTRLREGGVYLITGGVGGVGLVLAEWLAQSVRPKLVLTGRSAFPPREQYDEWLAAHPEQDNVSLQIGKIRELERLGAEVLVLSADVTERAAMLDVVRRARERFGGVNGVIHAAGVSPGGLIQVKTLESAAQVLAPKIEGTLVLDEIFKTHELDFLILCSSLVAIGGSPGMVDHAAANAFLDAFAHRRNITRADFTLSINWDTWLEVGQAANAKLGAGLKDILRARSRRDIESPLLEQKLDQSGERAAFVSFLSTAEHWVLDDHRVMGRGLLPGTAYLELVRAAYEEQSGGQPLVIQNMIFSAPLIVKDGEKKEVRTILQKEKTDLHFKIVGRAGDGPDNSNWQEHASGKIIPAANVEPTKKHDVGSIIEKCSRVVGDGAAGPQTRSETREQDAAQDQLIKFGPRWESLRKRFHLGTDEALAYIELPEEFSSDVEEYKIHPALLDAAIGFIEVAQEGTYLPLGYKRLTVKKSLPRKIYSHARFIEGDNLSQNETIACDIIVMDEDGYELIEIEEYVIKKLSNVAGFDSATNDGIERAAERAEQPLGTNVSSLQTTGGGGATHDLKGILPAEAAEAFARLLSTAVEAPQLAVSSRNLPRLLAAGDRFTAATMLEEISNLQAQTPKHPRPSVRTAYVAPRTELEQRLAEIWQEMLRIEQIGVHDNLFEIGGDSLLATQLISRIGEAFHVDLSLRTLFEAPTIAELQIIVLQRQIKQADGDAAAQLVAEIGNLSAGELEALLAEERQLQCENEPQV